MKKLALVLGSLLVVGSVAVAKETIPAPTVYVEPAIEYVEKPVIVYKDREVTPAWKPNGSVSLTYRWYGETENKTTGKFDKRVYVKGEDKDNDWAASSANVGRLQVTTSINFTKNEKLEIRSRTYNDLRDDENGKSSRVNDTLRVRHYYNGGNLGDSKVKLETRLHYNQSNGDLGTKTAEGRVMFDFSDYFPSNEYFKVTRFAVGPRYAHAWAKHGNDSTINYYAVDFESKYKLPYGFSAEFNIYPSYYRLRGDNKFSIGNDGEKRQGQFMGTIELYLFYNKSLYKTDKFNLSFNAEGGYDPYYFYQHKSVATTAPRPLQRNDRRSYYLYFMPTISASYKVTDNVRLSLAGGATYGNFRVKAESEAKNWRWQPTAWAGMSVTF